MLVKEVQSEGEVTGFFLIIDSQWRVAKNGNPYASLRLGDRTGEIAMKIWEISQEVFNELKQGTVIKVKATARNFNGSLQLEASAKGDFFRVCREEEYDPSLFLRSTGVEMEKLWAVMDEAIRAVKIRCYQKLLKYFFLDEKFRDKFGRTPAALRHHHAYLGGLLEHTVGVVNICQAAVKYYPRINGDLLMTGALLHDLGKVESYQVGPGFSGTDPGKLIGHLVLGIRMVSEAITNIRAMEGGDFFLVDSEWPLLHLLASHHGIKDWGSPVEPAFLEACILHHADYMDSEVSKFQEALRKHPEDGGNWTIYDQNLHRSVYLPILNSEHQAQDEEDEDRNYLGGLF